jgi:hypothetical protein
MDVFIHVANVGYLFSYLVRDILWLRILTIVAGMTLLPYFSSRGLYAPIAWNGLFISINGYQVYRLLLERRPVALSDREQRLWDLAFRSLSPRQFLKLLSVGQWGTATADEVIIEQGQSLERLMVVATGHVEVCLDARPVASLMAGALVGEIGFLTGEPTSASVHARGEAEYFAWPADRLKKFLDANPDLRAAVQHLIGTQLATKLRGEQTRLE